HIGTVTEKRRAERFVRFLASHRIEATFRTDQDTGYAVWVLDEDRVATARQQLDAFLARPDDPWFDVATVQHPQGARRFLRRRTPADRACVIDVRTESFRRRQWSTAPVTVLLIGVSVV